MRSALEDIKDPALLALVMNITFRILIFIGLALGLLIGHFASGFIAGLVAILCVTHFCALTYFEIRKWAKNGDKNAI